MNIGLIDVDNTRFPNLALGKIAAYHRSLGDTVEWADPMFGRYDRVYASKVFVFTPDFNEYYDCEVVKGGTGYDIHSVLPDEIDRLQPELSFGDPKIVHSKAPKNYNDNRKGIAKGLEFCSAPTLWQAQKWLRNTALFNVGVNPALPTRKWQFYIDDLNQHVNPHDGELMTRWDDDMQEKADEQMYDSYEQALSAGIEAALELIQKGE